VVAAQEHSDEIIGQLKKHYDEVVGAYIQWFQDVPQRPRMMGQLLIEYRLPGAAAFYMANDQVLVHPLVFPKELERLQEGMRGHLGAENWKRWETLLAEVNSNLALVVALWKEIGERMAAAARRAGLFAHIPTEPMVDTYWPELFVDAIWREPEYYLEKKIHSWESATIGEEYFAITLRHTLDTVQTWVFANSNMVRSQNKEPAEMMKNAWEEEAIRVEPIKKELMAERARIEANAKEFQSLLHNIEAQYARTSKLAGVCPTCAPLLAELNPSPQAPTQ
jgi:hypothetical protein